MTIGDVNCNQHSEEERVDLIEVALLNRAEANMQADHMEIERENDLSALQHAACQGHLDAVQSLLKSNDTDVNYRNSKFESALHLACYHGHSAVVESLLQGGADRNQAGVANRTPVFVAAANGKEDVVQILLQAGADVNLCNIEGLSPLHAAVMEKHSQVAYDLLLHGCSVNKHDNRGNLPIHYTVRHKNIEFTKLLLQAGSKKDHMNTSNESALFIAVYNSDLTMIDLLLNSGCDVNIKKPDGSGLLHAVVSRCDTSRNSCDIMEALIVAGCQLNTCAYSTLETPLYRALSLKKGDLAQVLLNHGATPNLSSPFDMTALHLACKNQCFVTINLLLHSGICWKRERWMEQVSYFQSHEDAEIFQLLKSWRREPVSLLNLSRATIRRHFKEKLVSKIGQLEVPASVKNFLLFSDVCGPTADVCSRQYFDKCKSWQDFCESSETDVSEGPFPDRKTDREDIT